MTEWLARIEGDERALDLLKDYLAETTHLVIKEGSRYYLKIADLPDDIAPEIIYDTASRFIDGLNGVAKLYFGKFGGIHFNVIVRIREDGVKEGVGFLTLPERSFALTLPPIPDGTLESWITACTTDDLVMRALTLYGTLEHNWKNLYMMLEVIEDATGGEAGLIKTGWITEAKIKSFKRTANSYQAIGREARHGTISYKRPPSPMKLEEARQILREILQIWLKSRSGPA